MNTVRGPAFSGVNFRRDDELDTSFRLVVGYDIGTDGFQLRLDVKKSGIQMNNGFYVSSAGKSDLVMPQAPAYQGVSVRANSQDLIEALRGMADALEQQLKDDVEKMKP